MDTSEQATVARRFDGVDCTAVVRPLQRGFTTVKHVVETERGQFVLRRLRAPVGRGRARFLATVQGHLAAYGYAVPLVYTRRGSPFCVARSGLYLLTPYVDGETLRLRQFAKAPAREYGALVGRAHAALSALRVRGTGTTRRLRLEAPAVGRLLALERHHRNAGRPALARSLAIKRAYVQSIPAAKLRAFRDLPTQVIHGDFYIENVVWQHGRAILIDFDEACVFYRCYEALRAVLSALLYVEAPARVSRVAEYFTGYCLSVMLDEAEVEHMIDLFRFVLAGDTFGFDSRRDPDGDRIEQYRLASRRGRLLWWTLRNGDAVRDVIRKANARG